MEVGRHFLSSSSAFPSTTHLRHPLPSSPSSSSSSTSVLMLHEQATAAVPSVPITFVARHFPTSVLLQEQRDEFKPLLHALKEEKTSQATLDRMQIETKASLNEDLDIDGFYQLVKDSEHQLRNCSGLLDVFSSLQTGVKLSAPLTVEPITTASSKHMDIKPSDAVALAKKALSASKEAVSFADGSRSMGDDFDDSLSIGLDNWLVEDEKTVRSTRLLERRRKRLKKKRVSKSKVLIHETNSPPSSDVRRKINEGFNQNDPLRLFLWGPETKQLLTAEEEAELIARVQDLFKLEEVKNRLQSQFGREPTLVEWAEAVGISCQILKSQLRSGTNSREKLIYANLRMVVHIAKQYQGRGLGLQDLMQEGSMGLMKSVEKFKPQAGCRFATYAYWWIRQTVRKAIFQHSRTIRLPENVYTLLGKVLEAKKSCIQEGNHNPNKEELARRVGITVEKLQKLLYSTRMPLSMQQPVWADQDSTFQR
ncbi:RNA polymerase sigma factor sigF, chloroplastic isoform X5 [Pyrus x bretschneideri]|uniref:RNA polymerase sigma factor sigF, chloroplastic isoform X5 n=1 Tax=Pyrus x bretschneideri TaxID=225117 RepID=UPI0020306F5D|nr:RNA polymerase sigma factor sigF, chloroplastic isoform X5 [Pyrus x bretschneideri]